MAVILPIRTDINNESQIYFCNSPIHVKIQNAAASNTIQSCLVYLYIWSGNQNKILGNPNVVLFKKKVSASDNYINFQISDYIKAFLVGSNNNPQFAYNENELPAVSGQGVFWQITVEVTSDTGIEEQQFVTNYATLGYRWNYEQTSNGNNGITPNGSNGFVGEAIIRNYNKYVPSYFEQNFKLDTTVGTATSSNIITMAAVIKPNEVCPRDSCLIAYINKLGLWELFTPVGKISVSSKLESNTSNRTFRNPKDVENNLVHSKLKDNLNVLQSYKINTGILDQSNIQAVEEIIYSPKVYLIQFKGDLVIEPVVGITVDSTFVTVDDTIVTVDSTPIGLSILPFFGSYNQIPVVVTDSDFMRKTRINDRYNIDYTLQLDETNNKINSIR